MTRYRQKCMLIGYRMGADGGAEPFKCPIESQIYGPGHIMQAGAESGKQKNHSPANPTL